ncbi:processed acidic surface protein [Peribacillus deserti]|uniref:Processed acidic surface protein n=1 Tax=Peribacillus deserti TaxID=673318 RepID=A0A2N5M851_9BACI|nr:processed acidic surface protein [Peribacillus deserti]PLT30483.1 processed acidic surface protein [Peribacillus deserti]
MKKMWAILLTFSLLLSLFPQLTMAAKQPDFDQKLEAYLVKVSGIRGFEVTKEDIEASLAAYDESLNDYETVNELSTSLGSVIRKDLSNLKSVYEEHEIDQAGLEKLLQENGEELDDYVYVADLSDAIYTYMEGEFEQDPNFEQDLKDYLTEVSAVRGFPVTREDIESYLNTFDDSLDTFESVDELREFMGDVIKADLSNLDYFNESYDLDKESLLGLLKENGKDIKNYVFMDQLEEDVWNFTEGDLPPMDEEIAEDILPIFEQELGLSETELKNIEEHLTSLEDVLSDPIVMDRLDELAEKMMAFEDFDMASELSPADIAEITSIYNEFLSIFQLKADYSLVKNGTETPLSIMDLFSMKELTDAKLKITLYSTSGKFLADLLITGDMVDSDTIIDAGEQVEKSVEDVKQTVSKETPEKPKHLQKETFKKKEAMKTVKGAKLPKTASDYIPNMLLGLLLAFAGFMIYRKVRTN